MASCGSASAFASVSRLLLVLVGVSLVGLAGSACAGTGGRDAAPPPRPDASSPDGAAPPGTDATAVPSDSATTDVGAIDAGEVDGSEADGGAADAGVDPAPWRAPIERCGNGEDDDGDTVVDEDCPPSLWSGLFVPGIPDGADFAPLLDAFELPSHRLTAVLQTYRSSSAAGADRIRTDLALIWGHGSVAHLNVEPSGYSAAQYRTAASDPDLGRDLDAVAAAVAESLSSNPQGRILFTFGAEMNGSWVDWGCLSRGDFVALYRRAHDAFERALAAQSPAIDPRRVRWVYGPNSTSSAGCGSASDYFPGFAYVDYLGMSAYRSGNATVTDAVIVPMKRLSSDLALRATWRFDRLIVLQTGTRQLPSDSGDDWVRQLFGRVMDDPEFLGVIYFDSADWAILRPGALPVRADGFDGWVDAQAALPAVSARLDGTFEPFFWDAGPSNPYYPEIQSLRSAGITSGCDVAPPQFCPDEKLRREDAATLLARAFGTDERETRPLVGCTGSPCTADLTRAELASALAALAHASSAPPTHPIFGDLGSLDPTLAASIEALARSERVDGCGDGAFCPDGLALRGPAAAWIVRSANVPPAPRL